MPPDPANRLAAMRSHLRLALLEQPESVALLQIRKHLLWYSRGLPGSVAFRRDLPTCTLLAQVEKAISHLARQQALRPGPSTKEPSDLAQP